MFNNCNSETNGEKQFYFKIKDFVKTIFDVGCRTDTLFSNFTGVVHYFDPVKKFIAKLSKESNNNKISIFNNVGLGNENGLKYYYPYAQSFNARTVSLPKISFNSKIELKIMKGSDYMKDKNIEGIDFLKIDIEGAEIQLFRGISDENLEKINKITMEYHPQFILDGVEQLKERLDTFFEIVYNTPITGGLEIYNYRRRC